MHRKRETPAPRSALPRAPRLRAPPRASLLVPAASRALYKLERAGHDHRLLPEPRGLERSAGVRLAGRRVAEGGGAAAREEHRGEAAVLRGAAREVLCQARRGRPGTTTSIRIHGVIQYFDLSDCSVHPSMRLFSASIYQVIQYIYLSRRRVESLRAPKKCSQRRASTAAGSPEQPGSAPAGNSADKTHSAAAANRQLRGRRGARTCSALLICASLGSTLCAGGSRSLTHTAALTWGKGTRRVQLVRSDGRDVSTLYGRGEGGGPPARQAPLAQRARPTPRRPRRSTAASAGSSPSESPEPLEAPPLEPLEAPPLEPLEPLEPPQAAWHAPPGEPPHPSRRPDPRAAGASEACHAPLGAPRGHAPPRRPLGRGHGHTTPGALARAPRPPRHRPAPCGRAARQPGPWPKWLQGSA